MIPRLLRFAPRRPQTVQNRQLIHFPSRRLLQNQNQNVRLHRVRFKKGPVIRGFFFKFICYSCAFVAWDKLVWTPFVNFVMQDEDEEGDSTEERQALVKSGGDKDLEGDDDELFIPLSIPRTVPSKELTDEEFDSVDKVLKDEEFREWLIGDLVDYICYAAEKNDYLRDELGIPIEHGGEWMTLWVAHEQTASPEFQHLGFHLHEQGVDLAVRSLSSDEGRRFLDILYPAPFVHALYGAGKVFLELKWAKLKLWLNGDRLPSRQMISRSGGPNSDSWLFSSGNMRGLAAPSRTGDSFQETVSNVEGAAPFQSSEKPAHKQLLKYVPKPDPDFLAATKAFNLLFIKNKLNDPLVPRAVVEVQGLLRLNGSHGFCTAYVTGFYSPVEDRWCRIDVDVKTVFPGPKHE